MSEECEDLWVAVIDRQRQDLSLRTHRHIATYYFWGYDTGFTRICAMLDICPHKIRSTLVSTGELVTEETFITSRNNIKLSKST